MDEQLILGVIKQVLADPRLQALMAERPAPEAGRLPGAAARPDLLVLLNYAPDLPGILQEIGRRFGAAYCIKVLASNAVTCKPDLPAGLSWVTCQEAFAGNWQRMILPTCSANTLAKIALGLRDTPISVLAGEGIARGIPLELCTARLGFTGQTPAPYRQLYEGYLKQVASYGVIIRDSLQDRASFGGIPAACQRANCEPEPGMIGWNSRLLTERDVLAFPEGSTVKFGQSTIVTPLAKDLLKRRRVEIRREGDGKL